MKIDYKNIQLLRNSITVSGKIIPKRLNNLNATGQRSISKAIKNARLMGFLPFVRLIGNPIKKFNKKRKRTRTRQTKFKKKKQFKGQ